MSGYLQESERDRIELDVFSEFSKRSPLIIDKASIEKRRPPEPDILCCFRDGERVAFELKELCSENIAKAVSHLLITGSEQPRYIQDGDPEDYVLKETLRKRYVTEDPIELLFYTDGRIGTPLAQRTLFGLLPERLLDVVVGLRESGQVGRVVEIRAAGVEDLNPSLEAPLESGC